MSSTSFNYKEDPDFKKLTGQKSTISLVLTILELTFYFGFIGLIAFNKPFLSSMLTERITIGIPIAVGVIVMSWILTGIYVRWANNTYDVLVKKVRDKVEG
ncbi:MAG: DUF485 domain-containing protein [Nitrospirota bacterium]|uniref:Membrane protein n=1 Tax=Candidatus Magnetominusculus xianensis TaxID=1748249 RepID=A0ABR5SKX5_9BACT|nr:DUF485 domain-containing protein [Candidatus Magnetominusculus xianensis]KWT95086.1 membrane protein [Candidatus Magnetominusculus xianensis]MBF0402735.1 DUF485 domain-containing protein [Nitrospirota bacterium]